MPQLDFQYAPLSYILVGSCSCYCFSCGNNSSNKKFVHQHVFITDYILLWAVSCASIKSPYLFVPIRKANQKPSLLRAVDHVPPDILHDIPLLEQKSFWRERAAFQQSAFGWSTAGNDVVATIFIRLFFFFPFFSSVATFSHRRSARIKKLI